MNIMGVHARVIQAMSFAGVIAPFLKVVSGICQNYYINTDPLFSFAHLLSASRFVCQLQAGRLSKKKERKKVLLRHRPHSLEGFINSPPALRQALKTHRCKSHFEPN